MITATCTNEQCSQHGIGYYMFGNPSRVQCGQCVTDCELTDPQPDPPMPEPYELDG